MDTETVTFFVSFAVLIFAIWWVVNRWFTEPPSLAVQYMGMQNIKSEADESFIRELMNPPAPQ
jgi:hypothetical protein